MQLSSLRKQKEAAGGHDRQGTRPAASLRYMNRLSDRSLGMLEHDDENMTEPGP